jgi:transposase
MKVGCPQKVVYGKPRTNEVTNIRCLKFNKERISPMTIYIGLDVHSKMSVYVAQNEQGKTIAQGEIATNSTGIDQLFKIVAAPPGTPIAMESGTQATWLSRLLEERGMKPVVVNAREVRAKARNKRQKNDRRDAFEICDGLRRGLWVSIVWIPPLAIDQLRAILSRRRHFVGLATRQTNAVKFLLRRNGMGHLYRSLKTEIAWQRLSSRTEIALMFHHIRLHHQLWREAQTAIIQLEQEMQQAARPLQHTLNLLETMPGIGPIVATTFLATLGMPHRFTSASQVIGYTGLAVSTYDTGQTERHGHITKSGSPQLRAMLCEAAHHAGHPTHPLHPYYARLAARRGIKAAVVAVSQRMARILWQMWREEKPFDLDRLNVQPVRKVKNRTIHWEIRPEGAATAAA